MSASKMRQFVLDDDFDSFSQGTPMNIKDARNMFDDIKKGMKLNENNLEKMLFDNFFNLDEE